MTSLMTSDCPLHQVRVTNPFQTAELRALLIWGNALAVRYLVSPALPDDFPDDLPDGL